MYDTAYNDEGKNQIKNHVYWYPCDHKGGKLENFEAEIIGKETYEKLAKIPTPVTKKRKHFLFIYNHSFHTDLCINML